MTIWIIALSINPPPLSALELKLSGLIMKSQVESEGDNQNANVIISNHTTLHVNLYISMAIYMYFSDIFVSSLIVLFLQSLVSNIFSTVICLRAYNMKFPYR